MEEKIRELLAEKFQEVGFQDCFLVDMRLSAAKKLELFIDADNGFTISQSAKISRYLQAHIDEAGWLGEKYILDVSSPGVGSPLKMIRQYHKNIGRTVEVKFKEGGKKRGILKTVTDEHISLEYTEKIKEGKKKKIQTIRTIIAFKDIKETKVKVTF